MKEPAQRAILVPATSKILFWGGFNPSIPIDGSFNTSKTESWIADKLSMSGAIIAWAFEKKQIKRNDDIRSNLFDKKYTLVNLLQAKIRFSCVKGLGNNKFI